MDIRSLNTFIQVSELASFTKAAERLGYSQPTVSFQIRQLEEELGIRLFDRIGHTVSLTEEGREALNYAQSICRTANAMSSEAIRSKRDKSIIRIAMADSLLGPMIVEKFSEFRRKNKNISLKITTAGTDELFRLLDHNGADIVCTLDTHIYNMSYVVSSEEKLGAHFVCSSNSPLTEATYIDINDLLSFPFILTEKGMSYRRMLDEKLAKMSLEVSPVLEIGSADLICDLVKDGVGLSFLPDYVTEKGVRTGELTRLSVKDFDFELWQQVLYHRDKWITPELQTVIDYLSK